LPMRCALVTATLVALSHAGAAFVFGGGQASGLALRDDFGFGQTQLAGPAGKSGRSFQQMGSPRGALWPAIGCVLVLAAARSRIPPAKGRRGASISMKATGIHAAACYSLSTRRPPTTAAASMPMPSAMPSGAVLSMPGTCVVSQMDLLGELDVALAVRASQLQSSEVSSVMVGASLAQAAAPQHRPVAARCIGGARRASRRAARSACRAASSEANERRHIGARLQAHPVVYDMPPPSYDVSRVRTKVQSRLRANSGRRCDSIGHFSGLESAANTAAACQRGALNWRIHVSLNDYS